MKYALLCLLLPILFSACKRDQEETACYHVTINDYTEKITVRGTIRAVNTTYLKAPGMFLAQITWLEEDGKYVRKGDTVCILQHPETTTHLESIVEQKKIVEAQLEKLEADHQVKLAMLQAEIQNNDIQVSINSLDSIQKRFAPPLQQELITLNQKKAGIQRKRLEKKFSSQKTIGETEIRGLNSRIRQMENQIQRVQDELDQLILTAPLDGVLMREVAPNIFFITQDGFGSLGGKMAEGSTTFSNMNLLQIPDMSRMEILAELSENDYKKAEEGKKVMIKVDARNNLITSGKVMRKMLTGKQVNRNSKLKTYEAIIEIDSCHNLLTPGLNAECEIILNELKDTLLVPAICVFEEEEKKYVYVRENKKFRKIPVEAGSSNSAFIVISSGLDTDTYIALSRPPAGKIIREKGLASLEEPIDSLAEDVPGNDSLSTDL